MKYVTISELADHLSVSPSTIRQWIRHEHIPEDTFIKISTTYRFDLKAVEDALRTRDRGRRKPLHSSGMDFQTYDPVEVDNDL
jgi:excisionase family DNA binding protein